MLAAATAGAMVMVAMDAAAQAPPPGGPGGGPPRMGMMGAADRPTTIQRQGLDDPALKLTDAQKAQIDKIVDAYLADQKAMRDKMTPGSPPSQDVMGAMRAAREKFTADIGKVLNDDQRKTWEAAQAARRAQFGGGGPGGGPGGPPPAR